jgi:NlpC/P60 family putative phage cell wall peptidase
MARRKKPTRNELVAAEAREWIETPFAWQQSAKGVGCDCKGLLWGVARELGFPEAESLYAKVADYSPTRPVPSALLKEGMAAIFDRVASIEEVRPGDVLLLKVRKGGPAGHIAIVSSEDSAIHAQIGSKDWVKETKLRALLAVCPLVSIWRWRDGR